MKKYLYIVIGLFLGLGVTAFAATNVSITKNGVLEYLNYPGDSLVIGSNATTTNSRLEVNGTTTALVFVATSTTATSTFQQLSFTNATGTNLSVTGSSSFALLNSASSSIGLLQVTGNTNIDGATRLATSLNGLALLTNGAVTGAATSSIFGVGVAGQVLAYLNGAIQWTSTTTLTNTSPITTTYGASNTWTIACATCVISSRAINTTYPVTGGGDLSADRTIGLAFGTTTTNTWSNLQTFTQGFISNASSTAIGGLTMTTATTTNATSTGAFYSGQLQSLDARVTNLTATSGITYADGFKQTRGSFQFGATDVNATTTDIFTMQSFSFPVTIQSISGIIDCPNGCIAAPSGITVKFWHGTNRSASTTATALFTVNPTFTSTTTLLTFSTGFNDNTLAANEILWYQIVAASTTQMSIDFSGVATTD